jgi:heat shock protein HslJ
VLVAAILQGCAPPGTMRQDSVSQPPLNDTAWTLASLSAGPQLGEPHPTLRFAAGAATGSDGCNRFHSSFVATNGKLELGPVRATTQMSCPEPAAGRAAALKDVLNQARGYRVEAGALLIVNAIGATLASFAAQTDTLTGTAWEVSAYNNGNQAVVSVISDTRLILEFHDEGKLRGAGGCNSFNGTFVAAGDTLQISRLATTRMACQQPEGRMAQEAALLAALETVATAHREASRLELRTPSGALAVAARQVATARP